jgi:hypothetical protein
MCMAINAVIHDGGKMVGLVGGAHVEVGSKIVPDCPI